MDWLRDWVRSVLRLAPGELLLLVAAVGGLAYAVLLAFAPEGLIVGPATSIVWLIAPPPLWAVGFAGLSVPPLLAVLRPSVAARRLAWRLLIPAGTMWAAGLSAPAVLHALMPGRWPAAPVLQAVAWWLILASALIVSRGSLLAGPFYTLRHDRRRRTAAAVRVDRRAHARVVRCGRS